MGQRPEGGQSVGNVQGRIGIDTSGVVTAERVVNQSSKGMTSSLNALNTPLSQIAQRFRDAQTAANNFRQSDLGQIQQGLQGLAGALAPLSAIGGLITTGGLAAAQSIQQINTRFTVFLGSAEKARAEMQKIRDMADATGQPFLELVDSAASLLSVTRVYNVEVSKLLTFGQQLRSVDPTARAIDVSIATREFLSGNARSLVARFELSKEPIEAILKSSTSAAERLDKLSAYLNKIGFSTDMLKTFGKEGAYAFDSLRSEITETLGTAFTPLLQNFVLPGVKSFGAFVRSLRETNPELLQFGSIAAVAAAGTAPLLLALSQLIKSYQTLKTVSILGAGGGSILKGGLAVGGGLLLGSAVAKGLAVAGVTTGDLGRVAKGEDPLAIVGERLKQGLVILVNAILDGAKPVVQAFAFAGSLVQNGGTVLAAAFDAAKAVLQNSVGQLNQSFGTLFVQIANNFSGLFDTTNLRKFGQDMVTVGQLVSEDAQKKLAAAETTAIVPIAQAAAAARKAGEDFDQAHQQIVQGLSQGLGLIPVEQAAEETATSLDKVTEAANPLVEAFNKNKDALEKAAGDIIDAKSKFAEESRKQDTERKINAGREEFDFNLQRARANRDANQQFAQQDTDFYRNRERSIADFNKGLNSEILQQQQQEAKQRADFAETEIRAAEDHGKRLAEIERNTRDSVQKAASRLDAAGVLEAQRNGQKQLDDEIEQYNTAHQRRQQDFDQQIAEQTHNNILSRDQRIADFQLQLADQQEQHDLQRQRDIAAQIQRQRDEDFDRNLRLSRQREDYARQDAERRNALSRQISDIINALAKETGIRREWLVSFVGSLVSAGNHIKDFAAFVNNAVASLPQITTSNVIAGNVPVHYTPTEFATGGSPTLNTVFRHSEQGMESALFSNGALGLLTRPATIIPAAQTAALLSRGGNWNIQNFNPQMVFGDIGKYSPDQIRQIAVDAMFEALDRVKEKVG